MCCGSRAAAGWLQACLAAGPAIKLVHVVQAGVVLVLITLEVKMATRFAAARGVA
jgi:hypothetical protein